MNEITMKTKVSEIVENPIVERKFKVTLHDGKDGTSKDGTTVEIVGRFDFSNTTIGRVLDLAEKPVRIAYQNGNRDENLKDGQTVEIAVGDGRTPANKLDKARKIIGKMSEEERKQLLDSLLNQ